MLFFHHALQFSWVFELQSWDVTVLLKGTLINEIYVHVELYIIINE